MSLSSLRFQGQFVMDREPLMTKTLHSFKKPRTTHPAMQRLTPEDKHPRPNGVHRAAFKRILVHVNTISSGFGGLEDACCPLVPKFAGSNPAEAVGFFKVKKSPARLPSEGK
jgi:hypothetical protein